MLPVKKYSEENFAISYYTFTEAVKFLKDVFIPFALSTDEVQASEETFLCQPGKYRYKSQQQRALSTALLQQEYKAVVRG